MKRTNESTLVAGSLTPLLHHVLESLILIQITPKEHALKLKSRSAMNNKYCLFITQRLFNPLRILTDILGHVSATLGKYEFGAVQ